jgi:hypothetical protein
MSQRTTATSREAAVRQKNYLFLPAYPNRATASRIIQRQFN